jgi:osmotically-inducible protein OsmY
MAQNNRNQGNSDSNNNRGRYQRGAYRQGNDFSSERENFGAIDRNQSDWNQPNYGYGSNYGTSQGRQSFGEAGFDRDFQSDYNTRTGNYGVGNHGEYRGNDQLNQWNDRNRGRFGDESGYGVGNTGRSDQNRSSGNWQGNERRGDSYSSDHGWNSGNMRHGNENRYGNDNMYGNDRSNFERTRSSSQSNDRDWWDKTSDEVSSWFGDEDAERRRRMDKMQSGMHKGKGPKGYKRSDDRIKEDINDRLSDDPYVDASEIDVEVSAGEVTLSGTVDSKHEKRRVEDIVEAISGVGNVENRLKVKTHSYANAANQGLNTYSRDKDIR